MDKDTLEADSIWQFQRTWDVSNPCQCFTHFFTQNEMQFNFVSC